MHEISFNVMIQRSYTNEESLYEEENIHITSSCSFIDKIIDWYKQRYVFLEEFYHIKIESIEFDKTIEKMVVKYSIVEKDEDAEIINESLMDCDDDGNHSLAINGIEYLVMGF